MKKEDLNDLKKQVVSAVIAGIVLYIIFKIID
jgi:hypothetical protein